MEFCPHGTRIECLRAQQATDELEANKKSPGNSEITDEPTITTTPVIVKIEDEIIEPDDTTKLVEKMKCKKLHFKKIIQSHTDESLGDCSFLNTCFHMDTCK